MCLHNFDIYCRGIIKLFQLNLGVILMNPNGAGSFIAILSVCRSVCYLYYISYQINIEFSK